MSNNNTEESLIKDNIKPPQINPNSNPSINTNSSEVNTSIIPNTNSNISNNKKENLSIITTNNTTELSQSNLESNSNNPQQNIQTSVDSPKNPNTEATPTTPNSEKKHSFLFHKSTGRNNKQRSFSLSFKNSHSRSSLISPNLSISSINNQDSNTSLNNPSSHNSSTTSLSGIKEKIYNQSEPSLCPESIINSQPLRSESSLVLKTNKSETHLTSLDPTKQHQQQQQQQQQQTPQTPHHHSHHHLFFYSLDRHHSRQSSSTPSLTNQSPSLNNSNYNPSLAIPPHKSSLSSSSSQTPTPTTPVSNNPEMLRKASSRSTINIGTTKSKEEYVSSSPVPMGMSIDDYEIGAQIGNGSSAVVYVAKYKPSQKTVCLKVIDLDMFERNQIDGLRKEIQIMSLCKHPNILTVYGSFVHESKLYIVTPLLSAGSCLNIMKYAYPDGFEEVVIATILKQALLGLEYLHKNGLIHRDVKAGNLLMSEDGLVQLADFGVSSSLMETGERKGLRKTFVGTPCWMAPEVMEQSGYDYKADIWSFGITALEMATGRAPFAKYPPIKVLMLTIENEPPTLDRDQCHHKYSKTFKEMIDLCLNKDPSKRPSAEKLLQHPFFKQAKKKSYLTTTILHNVPSIQMRPLKVVKKPEVENEGISWDFDSDEEEDKSNKVVKFATSSSTSSIDQSSSASNLNASSNCSITNEVPLTPIKEANNSIIKNNDISINNNKPYALNNENTNSNSNTPISTPSSNPSNTNNNLNNTIKNHSNVSLNNENESGTPSPPKYYMQRNSSSELGFHSLPRSRGRFIIDTNESAVHCESPASINNNSVSSLNRNSDITPTSSVSLKFNNNPKPMLRHLSLAEKPGSYSTDNLIIEKRSRFEVSSHPTPNSSEPKPSRFIITDGNPEGRRSRILSSEPPSRHSSNGSISSSNNSINSSSYVNLVGVNNEIENNNLRNINKKIEALMQNSERQNKLIEALSQNILQNKITRDSIYNSSKESNQCIIAAEALMDKLNEMLKELDYLKKENELLKQNIEKSNKINGQLNQKLIALEQENAILLQKKNQQQQ